MKCVWVLVLLIILTVGACVPASLKEDLLYRENGSIDVFFCPQDNCEYLLIKQLQDSSDIRCAFYDLNLKNLSVVLKQKKAEVLLHYSNFEGFGIPIKNSGLMHDKFCILDRRKIITGSMNPTFNGAYKNNNNLIIIESNYLANNYLEEFNELKAGRKDKRTEITHILFNNHSLENYFCPEDECKEKVMKHLKSAQKSIYFMTFSFTDKDIANLLIEKNKELAVRGIMEKKRINMKYNVFKMLKLGKVDVLLDENPHTFHHKVFIIDNETVITGSYNPTKSADERNDENILIISSKQTAEKYLEEWKQKWS